MRSRNILLYSVLIAFVYRMLIAGVFAWSASDVTNQALFWVVTSLFAIWFTHAIYRLVRGLRFYFKLISALSRNSG